MKLIEAFYLHSGNFHDASEERKLIESVYSKNNNYLLMDRAYKNNKALSLAKARGFRTILNSLSFTINNFINNSITSNDIFLT